MATNGSGRRGSARTRPSPAAVDTTPSTPSRRASRAVTAEGTPDTSARRVAVLIAVLAAALALADMAEKGAQNEYLTHHVAVADDWAFYQAKI